MKLGIDVTFLFDQYSRRGIGNYARQIVRGIILETDWEVTLFGFGTMDENLSELKLEEQGNVNFISLGKPKDSNLFNYFHYRFKYKRLIKQERLDTFFSPHLERMIPLGVTRTIVALHDVIPYATGKYSTRSRLHNFIKGIFYRFNLRRAAQADLIITNSRFSREELIEKAGIDDSKINAIHLGVNPIFRSDNIPGQKRDVRRTLIIYNITKPYIIYYGGLEANKNVPVLLRAFAQTINKYPDLKLVITGKEFKLGWDSKPIALTDSAIRLLELIEELRLKHKVIITGEVDTHHLPVVLSNAELYVNLSEYEGFGLAVTEALAAGVPVVAADRSCYPEVLGDAALLVDPEQPDQVAERLLQVLQDDKLRKNLLKKGLELSVTYDWDTTVKETVSIIEKMFAKLPPAKKLLILTPYFAPVKGGAEQNAFNLAKRAVTAGMQVNVLTSYKKGNPEQNFRDEIDGVKIRRFRRLNNAYYLGFYPGLLFGLLRSKADIIHVHGFGFFWHDFCLLLKKLYSRRTAFINTPHGPFMAHSNYSRPANWLRAGYLLIQKLFLNRLYDRVIQVNPYQEKWITDYGIDPEKIEFLPNGIPADELKKVDSDEAVNTLALKRKFVIAYIGRYEKYKGLQDVIGVLPELVKQYKSLRLVAMGAKGAVYNKLVTLVHELDLEDNVDLLLSPTDELKNQVLQTAKVFVMPSEWEAFGIAILEAMAKKCAIISTRTEGGKYLIKEKENGLLYNYGDREVLLAHLQTMLGDRRLVQQMQRNNYQLAKEYLWEEIAERYFDILQKVVRT